MLSVLNLIYRENGAKPTSLVLYCGSTFSMSVYGLVGPKHVAFLIFYKKMVLKICYLKEIKKLCVCLRPHGRSSNFYGDRN